jgi:phosphoglycolate phosphatase
MASAGRPAAVVFDLDGTLIDSRQDLATAVNATRAELGLTPLAPAQVVGMVGEGARKLVERALGAEVPPERFEEVYRRYLEHYGAVLLDTTRAYYGIPEALARLASRFPLAVLSNKPEEFSRRVLDGLGIGQHFREVVGGDSLSSRKPDPEGLHLLAKRLQVRPEHIVLVGDTAIDAATARTAGCPFALVTWGFAAPPDLARIESDYRFERPAELAATLAGDQAPPLTTPAG